MDKHDFVYNLQKTFKGSNDVILQDLGSWIDRKELTPFQLNTLYDKIKLSYRYKTFPTLAEIAGFFAEDFGENDKEFFESPIVRFRKQMSTIKTEEMLKRLLNIHHKRITDQPLNMFEIDLFSTYEDVFAEYGVMIDLKCDKREIVEHLKYVHQSLIDGEYFRSKFLLSKKKFVEEVLS